MKLVTPQPEGGEETSPHPDHLRWCREVALLCIQDAKHNVEGRLLPCFEDEETPKRIAEMVRALRDEGITPARARRLLKEMKGEAPALRVV